MAFCRLVFPLLVISVVQCYASSLVPVFLWGGQADKSVKSNPLTKITAEEFDGTLTRELTSDPFTVIFIEETLSVEDLSRKNSDGVSSFPYLHSNIGNALYLPAAENPLQVLNKLADPEKVDHVKLTENGLSAEIEPESGKFLFINLKDAQEGESRSDLLRRHNDFMHKMYNKLESKYGNVLAVYTAHYPSWTISDAHSRMRRQAQEQSTDHSLEGLRIDYTALLLEDGEKVVSLSRFSGSTTSLNNTEMNTTLNFENNNVTLNFVSKAGYWFFNSVTLTQATPAVTEQLMPKMEVYSLEGFAYRCAHNVSFSTVNETRQYTITFQDVKLQPYFTTNNTDLKFGDSFNCVGFFSAPIWSGLFVTFILLSITFYGIMMMLDIRTMDRFDDPKGKTITINAGE